MDEKRRKRHTRTQRYPWYYDLFTTLFRKWPAVKLQKRATSDEEDDDGDSEFVLTTDTNLWAGVHFVNRDSGEEETDEKDGRIQKQKMVVTPKSVLKELEIIPTNFSLENIDDKIFVLKQKIQFIERSNVKKELSTLIGMLENRKKYDVTAKDGQTFRTFFSQFDATNDEKIDALLRKYRLVRNPADIFIPEFPVEAVKLMGEYTGKIDELCGKKPKFSVIATEDSFKKAYEKRDPILLAQSPFGFYYYILGAWDEEMILLSEL